MNEEHKWYRTRLGQIVREDGSSLSMLELRLMSEGGYSAEKARQIHNESLKQQDDKNEQ
jgi:hypothetical protein